MKPKSTSLRVRRVLIALIGLHAFISNAQEYPTKTIRLVTSGVGGGPDFVARVIAPGLPSLLGQPVIVDNRSSGVIPGQVVMQAAPDGYTLLVYGNTLWIGSLLDKTPYDPVKDFSPVILATRSPNILVVHPSLPVSSVKELIALAKAKPGQLNSSAGGLGGPSQIAGELFKSMANVNIAIIPYQNGSQETADLLSGYVQMTFGSTGQIAPYIKSGRLRALAITSPQPSTLFPGLPTMASFGMPGYEAGLILGVLAPARTPMVIINRLYLETNRVLNKPEVKVQLAASGIEAVGSTPEEFAITIRAEMTRVGKVIQNSGLKTQ